MALLFGKTFTNGTAAPANVSGGLPYEADGSIASDVVSAIASFNQGLPLTANGRLANSEAAIVVYSSGQGFGAADRAVTSGGGGQIQFPPQATLIARQSPNRPRIGYGVNYGALDPDEGNFTDVLGLYHNTQNGFIVLRARRRVVQQYLPQNIFDQMLIADDAYPSATADYTQLSNGQTRWRWPVITPLTEAVYNIIFIR